MSPHKWNVDDKNSKHMPHQGEWAVAPHVGVSMRGRWLRQFNQKIEGLSWKNV